MFISAVLAATIIPMDAKVTIVDFNGKMGPLIVAKRYDVLTQITAARFAPEFTMHKADGRKMDLIDLANGGEAEMRNEREGRGDGPLKYVTTLHGWERKGDTIVVKAINDVVGEAFDGKRRKPVKFKSLVLETWVRRDGEWKGLRFDEKWVRGTFDGKPIRQGA